MPCGSTGVRSQKRGEDERRVFRLFRFAEPELEKTAGFNIVGIGILAGGILLAPAIIGRRPR